MSNSYQTDIMIVNTYRYAKMFSMGQFMINGLWFILDSYWQDIVRCVYYNIICHVGISDHWFVYIHNSIRFFYIAESVDKETHNYEMWHPLFSSKIMSHNVGNRCVLSMFLFNALGNVSCS